MNSNELCLESRTLDGTLVAHIFIRSKQSRLETLKTLHENHIYEYDVSCQPNRQLVLISSANQRDRNITPHMSDSGILSTAAYCGLLHLELYDAHEISRTDDIEIAAKAPIGHTFVEVRSRKVNYDTSYRNMVLRLTNEFAGLLADSRSATHLRFTNTNESLEQFKWLQLQIELLRAIIEHPEFTEAMERFFRFPHDSLDNEMIKRSVQQQKHWRTPELRQLLHRTPQQSVPENHYLNVFGVSKIAENIITTRRVRTLDTGENRFIKFMLQDYLQFSTHVYTKLIGNAAWLHTAQLAQRLRNQLQHLSDHTIFREIGQIQHIPIHSTVLQRKAGYRELLRWWIQFHSSMEVRWENSNEIFHAGNRKTETLYEYWLFFVMLDVYEAYCGPIQDRRQIYNVSDTGITIKQNVSSICGNYTHSGATYKIQLRYNPTFHGNNDASDGSWTVKMRPDYTFTIWPDHIATEELAAQANEIVRIHFDAKYRVNSVDEIFNLQDDESESQDTNDVNMIATNYKHDDIRKMHAYLDAIHHSIGAFVLFPGNQGASAKMFKRKSTDSFPRLGAFSVVPDSNGTAHSLNDIHNLLKRIFDSLPEYFLSKH